MKNEITLVTSSDEHFLSGAAVVFASALAHLSPCYGLRAVLLACDIDNERRQEFIESLAPLASARFALEVIPLSRERFAGMKHPRPDLSVASYGRLFIPQLLKEASKVLYLDSDIIVTRDLSTLWEMSFEGHALMAVKQAGKLDDDLRQQFSLMDHDRYFVAATLLMHLDQIRATGADRTCLKLARHRPYKDRECTIRDQNIINIVFANSTKYVDPCWGQQVFLQPDEPNVVPNEPVLIHTVFVNKPWFFAREGARGIIKLFYHYLDMTRWEEYRDDKVKFHHTCSTFRYIYTFLRMRLPLSARRAFWPN